MITDISMENFKSWRKIDGMRFGQVTGIFGSNSSGKTSILQMLLLLKQTTESPDRRQVLELGSDRTPVALGTFRDVLYQHASSTRLKLAVSWKPPEPVSIGSDSEKAETIRTLKFETSIGEVPSSGRGLQRMVVQNFTYSFDGRSVGMRRRSAQRYELEPADNLKRGRGRPAGLPQPTKCYGFPDKVKASYQNAGYLADLELAFEELFERVHYLGPLREYPKREYIWTGAQPADMGRKGEYVVDALLASRSHPPLSPRKGRQPAQTVERRVAEWLRELGLIEDFRIEEISSGSYLYRVIVRKHQNAAEVALPDVGFGVSQALPVITLCYYAPKGSTLILEQPELHLHPMVQSALGDVLIDAIKTRNLQIVLESHSEHLLRRLQRRVAEEVLKPEETALYFCEIVEGTSQLKPLVVDPFGNITNWPKDFFGDEFGEMAAMTKAALARQGVG